MDREVPSPDEKLTIRITSDLSQDDSWRSNTLAVTSPRLAKIQDGVSDVEYLGEHVMHRLVNRSLWVNSRRLAGRNMYRWAFLLTAVRGWLVADLLGDWDPWRAEALEIFRKPGSEQFPLHLSRVTNLDRPGRPTREEILWQYVASESLVDYVVDTYGRERLPELLGALAEFDSWTELIPALFGVPADTFAAGWNLYLEDHYLVGE